MNESSMKPTPNITTPRRIKPCGPKRSMIQPSTGPMIGALHLLERRRAGERGLVPAAVVLQHRDVAAEGVVQQPGLQELQAATRADHLPAVEKLRYFSRPVR